MIIKVVLDTRKPNKKGEYPVKFRFANMGKSVYHFLGMYGSISEFDDVNGMFYLSTLDKRRKTLLTHYNSIIISESDRANMLAIDLKKKGQGNIMPSKFKDLFLRNENKNTTITLNSYFREFIEKKTGRTAEIYEATLHKIEKHFGKTIYFEDVNYSWLESLDYKMQHEKFYNSDEELIKVGLETNGRGIHFRNIRAVFNNAIDNEIIGLELYPFRRFKIKKEETAKRAMKLEHIQALFDFQGTPQQNWSVDVAKIIFFLIGINVKDLFYLEDLSNETTIYKRAKTKKLYNIHIEPELRVLLDKYKGSDGLIFKDEMRLYQSFGSKVNDYLKEICKVLNIPKITTYSLRHTWATLAGRLDIPDKTIAMALGHGKKTTTSIYIDFDMEKVKIANRQVIDLVLSITSK